MTAHSGPNPERGCTTTISLHRSITIDDMLVDDSNDADEMKAGRSTRKKREYLQAAAHQLAGEVLSAWLEGGDHDRAWADPYGDCTWCRALPGAAAKFTWHFGFGYICISIDECILLISSTDLLGKSLSVSPSSLVGSSMPPATIHPARHPRPPGSTGWLCSRRLAPPHNCPPGIAAKDSTRSPVKVVLKCAGPTFSDQLRSDCSLRLSSHWCRYAAAPRLLNSFGSVHAYTGFHISRFSARCGSLLYSVARGADATLCILGIGQLGSSVALRYDGWFQQMCLHWALGWHMVVRPCMSDSPGVELCSPVQLAACWFCRVDGLCAMNSLTGEQLCTRHNDDWGLGSRCLISSRFAHGFRAIAFFAGYWRLESSMALSRTDVVCPLPPVEACRRGFTRPPLAWHRPLHALMHPPLHDSVSPYIRTRLMVKCFFVTPFYRFGEAQNPGPRQDLGFDYEDDPLQWTDHDLAVHIDEQLCDVYSQPPEWPPDLEASLFEVTPPPSPTAPPVVPPWPPPSFAPSPAFVGARRGCVFKLGHSGLGYYRDEPPSLGTFDPTPRRARLHTANRPVLSLDALLLPVPSNAQATHTPVVSSARWPAGVPPLSPETHPTSSLPDVPVARRRRNPRRKRTARTGYLANAQLPDRWPDDVSYTGFRKLGLWAIDTVNPNCGKGALEHLKVTGADICLFQEFRRRDGQQCHDSAAAAKRSGWDLSITAADVTQANRCSGGLAIAARSYMGVSPVPHSHGNDMASRVHVAWIGSICRGGFFLLSIYLWDSEGLSERNLAVLHRAAAIAHSISGPWLIGGDFNLSPTELLQSGWLAIVGGSIVAPSQPTCNGSVNDFFVIKASLYQTIRGIVVLSDCTFAPHHVVRLFMVAAPRRIMVRQMSVPRALHPSLPLGCLPSPRHDADSRVAPLGSRPDAAALDQAFSRWTELVEEEFVGVACLPPDKARQWSGRVAGPRFVLRPAVGPVATKHPDTTPASRAWRKVAMWASAMLRHARLLRDRSPLTSSSIGSAAQARRHIIAAVKWRLPEEADTRVLRTWLLQLRQADGDDLLLIRMLHDSALVHAQAAERAQGIATAKRWREWVVDGPAQGLRNQHRYLRTAVGWAPARVGHVSTPQHEVCYDDLWSALISAELGLHADMEDRREAELTARQARALVLPSGPVVAPLGSQQLVDLEAVEWSQQWAVDDPPPPPAWPPDLGPPPPTPTLFQLRQALLTFAAGVGLGWDGMHPRALLRMPDSVLLALIRVFLWAEELGRWPSGVAVVIVALLPKPDGGHRPIGLFPTLVRIWARLRKELSRQWERDHERPYFFAGAGKPATVAAWSMAARAEASLAHRVAFAAVLLDMVKAFERVPHDVLVQMAVAYGYPLHIIRLSIASYLLERVVRIGGTFSVKIRPRRGITAGAVHATTELRILLIDILDDTARRFMLVVLTAYVDDIGLDAAGDDEMVVVQLASATNHLAQGIKDLCMDLSLTKNVVVASHPRIGQRIESKVRRWRISLVRSAKVLGSGFAAGTRRNVSVQAARLRTFVSRKSRFHRLRAAGADVARIMSTGGIAALTFGQAVIGVASHVLLRQRRAVAATISADGGGKDLDLALICAERSDRQAVDPAFIAHEAPIGEWADAIWTRRLPTRTLASITASAMARLARSPRPWAIVTGPAAAFVASAARIGWTVRDAFCLRTDDGHELNLTVDPPVIVRRHVHAAVSRWRWRNVETRVPELYSGGRGLGANFGPIRRLLHSTSSSPRWRPQLKAPLRSAVVRGQWPQTRLCQAGKAPHPYCLICQSAGIPSDAQATSTNLILEPPKGSLAHRNWLCGHHDTQRKDFVPEALLREAVGATQDQDSPIPNLAFWERALAPSLLAEVPVRPPEPTFVWSIKPDGGLAAACWYVDGSRIDNQYASTERYGWAFVACDSDGVVVAVAYGTPPAWVTSVAGAEAWALLMAALHSYPPSTFRTDCLECLRALKRGSKWATGPTRPLARIFANLFPALDDYDDIGDAVAWMLAHKKATDHALFTLSNGERLTSRDVLMNARADLLAKKGATTHRVPTATRRALKAHDDRVSTVAAWIGHVTFAANNLPDAPWRDSEPSASRPRGTPIPARRKRPKRPPPSRPSRPARRP